MEILRVTPENVDQYGLFCIKNKKNPGYHKKLEWFLSQFDNGLHLYIAMVDDTQAGFIECIPAEHAWRPVQADNCLFIHCLMVDKKKFRQQGIGKELIRTCMDAAKKEEKDGIAVLTSHGPWLANSKIFSEMGFEEVGRKDRFELMLYKIKANADAAFMPWENTTAELKGWHLVYANQCPWHDKSVHDLLDHAIARGIDLQIDQLQQSVDRAYMPSGFGTYALVHDGKLLADHYISKTRFRNILKAEDLDPL